MKFRDMTDMTNREIYKLAKSKRDLLFKRKKRLEKAIERDPIAYSKFGLEKLQEGIPMVSTKMGRVALKRSLLQLDDLQDMVTTTNRGAKAHQERLLRKSLNLPEGRLKKKDNDIRNESLKFIQEEWDQGRDVLSDFWKAFTIFKNENMYRLLDSKTLLKEYNDLFKHDDFDDIEELTEFIRMYIAISYEKSQQTDPTLETLEDMTKPTGWNL